MRKIGLAVGLALAAVVLVLAWGAWGGASLARVAVAQAGSSFGDMVINEVAWMGTAASSADEWIELYNATGQPITLAGWTLSDGGDISVTLGGVIPAGGFFLLERSDDGTVSNLPEEIFPSSCQ